jgi:hypothetical protein
VTFRGSALLGTSPAALPLLLLLSLKASDATTGIALVDAMAEVAMWRRALLKQMPTPTAVAACDICSWF